MGVITKFLFLTILFVIFLLFAPDTLLPAVHQKNFNVSFPSTLDSYSKQTNELKIKNFKKIPGVNGPESLAYFNGRMVTCSNDGYLYEVKLDTETVHRLFPVIDDDTMLKHDILRRPLGLRFDSKGNLWVVEPSYGVFRIKNVFGDKPKVELMFDIEQTAELGLKRKSVFLDDVAVEEKSSGGYVLYMSDVSSKYSLADYQRIILEFEANGRILRYDTDSKKLDAIADNLFFPNGIEILPNNKGIIFAECVNRTIWKYETGNNNLNIIMKEMPSETDNIRISANGKTFWLAMLTPRTQSNTTIGDYVMQSSKIRKIIVRGFHLIGSLLDTIGTMKHLAADIKSARILPDNFQKGGLLLEIDENGKIINGILDVDSEYITHVTEVREVPSTDPSQRILYLGAVDRPYIRKLILKK